MKTSDENGVQVEARFNPGCEAPSWTSRRTNEANRPVPTTIQRWRMQMNLPIAARRAPCHDRPALRRTHSQKVPEGWGAFPTETAPERAQVLLLSESHGNLHYCETTLCNKESGFL